MKLKGKLILVMIVALVFASASVSIFSMISLNNLGDVSLGDLETVMYDQYDVNIKEKVDMLIASLNGVADKVVSGEIPEEEGKYLAADIIRNARYGEDGYFWADDMEGNNIVLLGREDVEGTNRIDLADINGLKIIAEMIDIVENDGSGYIDYYFPRPGEEEALRKRGYVAGFDTFGWVIGTGNYVDDIESAVEMRREGLNTMLASSIRVLFLEGIIITLIGAVFAVFFSRSISAPIIRSSNYLKIMETGDFTLDIDPKDMKRKDEVGIIVTGVYHLKESLSNLVLGIQNESESIKNEVDSVSSNIERLNKNLEEVSATTEELAASMEETAASSDQMADISKEIENAVNSIATRSQEGAITAGEISKRADETKANVDMAQKRAEEIFENTKTKLEKAIVDAEVVSQINILSDSIMQITEQTNLLALNAAIEAARAGEAGKGFSVVADEIRKLAEQSKDAVLKIQEVTSGVTDTVSNLADNANALLTFVANDVNRDYHTMLEVAALYDKDALFVDDLVSEFSATSEELLASIHNVLQAIDGVATAANESAGGTSDIASRTSDAYDRVKSVMVQINKTAEVSEKLHDEVQKFKV